MRQFYIFCNGGFGNRFYSLLNGLYLAYQVGMEPMVIWPINNWCQASFEDCFDSELLSVDIDYQALVNSNQTINILHNNFFDSGITWMPALTSNINQICQYINSSNLDVFTGTDQLAHYVDLNVVVNGLLPFVPLQTQIIESATNKRIDLFNDQVYYGIHIRKTDAAHYVNEQQLESAIDQNPNKLFFVCSDSQETENYYSKKHNVRCNSKSYYVEKLVHGDWNTRIIDNLGTSFAMNVNRPRQSVIQALEDLLLLSYSDLSFNTSHLSSFLSVAKLLQKTYEK